MFIKDLDLFPCLKIPKQGDPVTSHRQQETSAGGQFHSPDTGRSVFIILVTTQVCQVCTIQVGIHEYMGPVGDHKFRAGDRHRTNLQRRDRDGGRGDLEEPHVRSGGGCGPVGIIINHLCAVQPS